jgi:hypothetical protein
VDRHNAGSPKLKAFLEQAFRPGFAMAVSKNGGWTKLLSGCSARVVVTTGMPAPIYRCYFGAHGLKSLTQNLALVGGPADARWWGRSKPWATAIDAIGSIAALIYVNADPRMPGHTVAKIHRLRPVHRKGATMHTGIACAAAVTIAQMSDLSSYASSATAQPYGGGGMMDGWGGWIIPFHSFGLLFWILVIAGVVRIVRSFSRTS